MSFTTPLTQQLATAQQLHQLITQGTCPHAILLHGPQGVGKEVLAHHLTLRLICGPAPTEADMFGASAPTTPLAPNTTSPQYHQLLAGSCPDFYYVSIPDKKKSIGIDQIRELLHSLKRSADTSRVVLITPFEAVTPEAANALLKVLEEPRPGIYFILVTHRLSTVLPTIRSRCRLFRQLPPAGVNTLTKVIPTYQQAVMYSRILQLQAQQATYNLPAQAIEQEIATLTI